MSFLNRIGLGFLDPTNELDKLANSFKDGDVSGVLDKLREIFASVEDQVEDIADLFEDKIDSAKKDIQREVLKTKRRLLREARKDLEQFQAQFGQKLIATLKPQIAEMVEAEVTKRLAFLNEGAPPKSDV